MFMHTFEHVLALPYLYQYAHNYLCMCIFMFICLFMYTDVYYVFRVRAILFCVPVYACVYAYVICIVSHLNVHLCVFMRI